MDLAQRQKQPLVFPDVERGRKIPDRWQDIHDLPRDPAELAIEAARVIDMLNRVRAQHRVELLVGETTVILASSGFLRISRTAVNAPKPLPRIMIAPNVNCNVRTSLNRKNPAVAVKTASAIMRVAPSAA